MTGALSKTSPNIITNAIAVAQRETAKTDVKRRVVSSKRRRRRLKFETFSALQVVRSMNGIT